MICISNNENTKNSLNHIFKDCVILSKVSLILVKQRQYRKNIYGDKYYRNSGAKIQDS